MNTRTTITKRIQEAIRVKELILNNPELIDRLATVAGAIAAAYNTGNKTLFCGNGGSAADAQHLAAELSGKFYLDRPPIHAEACHVNSSFLTAVSNDFGYAYTFGRYIQAVGKQGDVLVAISTSGNSLSVSNAVAEAKKRGMTCIGMTGQDGGKLKDQVDILLNVPSEDTPRIQEAHIFIGHVICELVEAELFAE